MMLHSKGRLALGLCVLAAFAPLVLSSTASSVTAESTTEDHHADEHHDDHGSAEDVISDYHLANLVISWIVLALVDILGFPVNTLALVALFKVRQKKPDAVLLITSMLSNYIVFLILIPMCLIALLKPDVLGNVFCHIHGELTFCYALYNILAPATMSLDRADLVGRSHKRFFTIPRAIVVQVVIICCAVALTIGPLFGFRTSNNAVVHEHSCHLWTVEVDDMVYFHVGSVSIGVTVTLITMIVCYGYIFRKVNRSVAAVTVHSKPVVLVQPAVSAVCGAVENTTMGTCGAGSAENLTEPSSGRKKTPMRADVRAAVTSVFVVTLFVVLWLPWIGVNLAIVNNNHGLPPELRVTTMIFIYIPAAVNPITYSYMLPKISSYFSKLKKKYGTCAKK